MQLKILHKVHEFCEANNIKYSLAYGSLIGAVRHQGYIPWDDDIDICMLREDYNKFISSFNKSIDGFKVRALETDDNYPFPYAKIESLDTRIEEESNVDIQIGVNIDVFPIDGIVDNKQAQKKFYKKLKRKHWIYILKIVKIESNRNVLKNFILLLAQIFLYFVPLRKLSENIDSFIDKNNNTSQMLCEQELCVYGLRSCFPRSCMKSYQKMKFEDGEFYVMNGWHQYLSNVYGDYMKLPPKDKQVTHHSLKSYLLS